MVLLLQQDGRMSFVDMAKEIGVTEGTIRRKFNRLVNDGIIHIAAVADPFKVGFQTPVLIGLKVDATRIAEVIRQVSSMPRVRYILACTGQYDLMAEGYFACNQDLSDFLFNELSKVDGIREISTSLILNIFKQTFTWGVASLGGEIEAEPERQAAVQ